LQTAATYAAFLPTGMPEQEKVGKKVLTLLSEYFWLFIDTEN
jgi:hypothetical protein